MAFAPHRRLTFSGIFGTTASPYERWSVRLNFDTSEEPGAPNTAMVQAARAAWVQHVAPRVGTWCVLTEVKGAAIGADGHYTDGPTIEAANVSGTSGFASQAPQIALAISLTTDLRGPRHKGRFYLPAPGVSPDGPTGAMDSGEQSQMATSMAAFLNSLNSTAGFGNVVIASSFGTNTPVSGVKVGRVLDTIRSRRTSIPEAFAVPLAITP